MKIRISNECEGWKHLIIIDFTELNLMNVNMAPPEKQYIVPSILFSSNSPIMLFIGE